MRRYLIYICVVVILLSGCRDDFGEVNLQATEYLYSEGVFIVNEGLYGQGNTSLSFIVLDSLKVYQDIFYAANNRPLGDVAMNLCRVNDILFIVVNNTGKVEAVDLTSMLAVETINGFTMPIDIVKVDAHTLYVSDLNYGGVHVVDVDSKQIVQHISTGKSTQDMLCYQDRCFVCNWSSYYISKPNNTVQVIDVSQHQLVDSVVVGKEPNSILLDKDNKIWVLCSGGYLNEEYPRLLCIDPISLQVEKDFVFPSKAMSPDNLCINAGGDSLYYLNTDVYVMDITDTVLPSQPLVVANTKLFYALAVSPQNQLFVSDAIGYQQNGDVYIYAADGTLLHNVKAGIIPTGFLFVE